MTKEEKMKLLDRDIELLSKMITAISRIKAGEPSAAVLLDMGLNEGHFKKTVGNKGISTIREENYPGIDEEQYIQNCWWLPTLNGMERLFLAVVGGAKLSEIPLDVEDTMKKALKTLTPRERKVLHMRYDECLTLDEMVKYVGVTRERIRQIEAKAIRKLRHPSRLRYIKAGDLWVRRQKDNHLLAEAAYWREKEEEMIEIAKEIEKTKGRTMRMVEEIIGEKKAQVVPKWKDMDISELELSVRSYNCLIRSGRRTVQDILDTPPNEFLRIRNLGRKSVKEIVEKVHEVTGIRIEVPGR